MMGSGEIGDEDQDFGSSAGTIAACVILGLCFLLGLPGNLLVVWTILKFVKQRSHTVLLILHLAAADLLVLVTLPLWIFSLAQSWVFGATACKAMVYIIYASMYSSVFIITIMSVERFLAIRYPLKMLYWQNGTSLSRILAVTWILSFILGIPVILTVGGGDDDDDDDGMNCLARDYHSMSFEVFCMCLETALGFVIPFFTLVICYCQVVVQLRQVRFKTKPKSGFLIGGVVTAFILCWLPHHILNVISLVDLLIGPPAHISNTVVFISGALAFISSSVNPVLYAFASRNFQGSLKNSGFVKLFQDLASHTLQMKEGFLKDSGLQNGQMVDDHPGGEPREP